MNKKIISGSLTLSGVIIGAGILGLPYIFSQSGFLVGLFWLIFLGIISTFIYLYICEVCLRTKKRHQLPGLAEKYLGKYGKVFMFIAVVAGIYSSLIAYLIGEGESISTLVLGNTKYAVLFAIGFWIVLTLLLEGGIERLKKVESYGVIAVIIIILGIFFYYISDINTTNLTQIDNTKLFIPIGVTIFALLGFTSIPEIREEMEGSEKDLKKVIIIGVSIPIFLYFIFTLTFVGILGKSVNEIATLSFGPIITLLGMFTMFTSYFGLSFALKDVYIYDLKLKKKGTFLFTSLVPLLAFLILYLLNLDSFINIIGIGGIISGGLTTILIILMNYKAKKKGDRKPEYSIYINHFIIGLIALLFIAGVILEIIF